MHGVTMKLSYKYFGIIFRRDLNWVDEVNYMVQKVCKALHFVVCFLKKGNKYTESLA